MSADDSITVVVPALNEEDGLTGAVESIREVVGRHFTRYEILVFDDGSNDDTGRIADELAARYPEVQAFHHPEPIGLGGVIRRGWEVGRMQWVIWVDGQGVTRPDALDAILAARGRADLVVPYASNQHERSLGRRAIARAFRGLMNVAFRLDLEQYTHLVLCELQTVRRVRVRSRSHALQAEALIKMIKSGSSYVQVGVTDNFKIEGRKSKAFRIANVLGVVAAILGTFWDVVVTGDFLASPPATRPAPGGGHDAERRQR